MQVVPRSRGSVKCLSLFAFLSVLAGLCAAAAAQVYTPTVIETFGGNQSFAHAINEAGNVVGYAKNEAGENRAFLYSGGMLTNLGTLGGSDSQAFAINSSDHVVGFSRNANGVERAFRFAAGNMVDIGTLGGTVAYGFDINDAGQVAGGSTKQFDTQYRAYRLTGTTMSDLGTLGGFLGSSEATGIDGDGTVVGWTSMLDFSERAFVYSNNQMTTLPTLGGTYSYAEAIKNGVIVGGAFLEGNADFRAVRWSNGMITNLETLPGKPSSIAYALNSTGQIVGKSDAGSDESSLAFLYLGGTMIDLNALLPSGSGWILQQARGINDAGQIVGFGSFNGQSRGFILNLTGKIWTNSAGGSFAIAQNWYGAGAPAQTQSAAFPLQATYTVDISSPAASKSLEVSRGDVTFNLNGAGYDVTEQIRVGSGSRLAVTGSGRLEAANVVSDGVINISGGELRLRPGGGTSRVTELQIAGTAGAWSGRVDVTNNGLVIDYLLDSPIGTLQDQIRTARGSGAWEGNGIASSSANSNALALAYAEAATIFTQFPASFGGHQIDSTSLLLQLTRYGDANLDGVVNLADFNALAGNFGNASRFWRDGDFNYDSVVNLSDFNLLAANFGLTASARGPTADDWAALAAAVPEPSSAMCVAALVALLTRRCRASSSRRTVLP